jgi:hypothetical protein
MRRRRARGVTPWRTAPCQPRARCQRFQLAPRHVPPHRRQAAIRAREQPLLRHELQRPADGVSHFLGGLDHVAGHIDHADHHVLAGQQLHQVGRHMGVDAFQAHLVDAAAGKRGEHRLVLAPFVAQGALPVGIGLDAVAVADVHRRRAGQALRRALERLHAPVGGILHVDIEGGLVELDDVHAIGLKRQGLLVEQLGEGEGHLDPSFGITAVEAVRHGVDDGHRAGQGELQLLLRVRTRQLCLEGMHAALQAQGRHHLRHHRVVAVVADAHLHLVLEVDALDLLEKAVHEVLPRLLAVAHDVQACVFLGLDPQQGRVGLGLAKRIAFSPPLGPELVGFSQPGWLRQAAGDGGFKHLEGSFKAKDGGGERTSGPFSRAATG